MPPINESNFRYLYAEPLGTGTTTKDGYIVRIGDNIFFAPDDYKPNPKERIEAEMRTAGITGPVLESSRLRGMRSNPPKIRIDRTTLGQDPNIPLETTRMFKRIAGEHVLFERHPSR